MTNPLDALPTTDHGDGSLTLHASGGDIRLNTADLAILRARGLTQAPRVIPGAAAGGRVIVQAGPRRTAPLAALITGIASDGMTFADGNPQNLRRANIGSVAPAVTAVYAARTDACRKSLKHDPTTPIGQPYVRGTDRQAYGSREPLWSWQNSQEVATAMTALQSAPGGSPVALTTTDPHDAQPAPRDPWTD